MINEMLEELFDIKNDKRLSVYLYRVGFVAWLLYLILGAPAMRSYAHYRTDCGLLCFVLMIVGFSISLVYDYFHQREAYEYKKKWLFISYVVLAGLIYFVEFNGRISLPGIEWISKLF